MNWLRESGAQPLLSTYSELREEKQRGEGMQEERMREE